VLVWVRMRPDPLLTAVASRAASLPVRPAGPALPASSALSTVARSPRAVLALATIIGSQAVMVSVMTMTPVQMKGHGATLTLVGLTISLHIAGMYGLSPVFGWLADRWGRVPVLLLGQGTLLLAALVAGTAGQSPWRLGLGLVLLGLGWSAGLISGSTLLAESVPDEARPGVQGTSDLLMNLVGAFGAAASGVVMAVLGFGGVNAVAAVIVLPVLVLAVRARRG
jgi:MFS family permease